MIRLKNIKLENNIISADFYPEMETGGGIISVDARTGEVVNFEPAPRDFDSPSPHAVNRLMEIVRLQEEGKIKVIPNESIVLWY